MTKDYNPPRRVGIFGGTGYVGSYLVDALLVNNMHPVLLVRPGSEDRVEYANRCTIVSGDIDDQDAINQVAAQSDALIYNIGILREFPRRGITFERLQYSAACQTMDAAVDKGVSRFLLMSANGVKADGTAYQSSKYRAESYLKNLDLDWTILRPSVLFGDPHGRMEFATQLATEIIDAPLPAPLFHRGLLPFDAGSFLMSPVHVTDVAAAFVKALQNPQTIGQTLHLGGPERISWKDILKRLAAAKGRSKLMLPAPALGVAAAAALLERFESFPITRDQIRMLLEGNACAADDLERLGIEPRPFTVDELHYLALPAGERAAT
ncbi:MAG: NAD(P)H-binding protein [Gammaproteobacteria bacterium]|nr:NAD(P)H-binding protein [Gammaproteobacteria bacterium]